jgi:hypothetical protein
VPLHSLGLSYGETMNDELQSRVARLALSSGEREAGKSARLRRDAEWCGFTDFYRAFQRVFGPGVRIVYFQGRTDSYGVRGPHGIPVSEPPPEPLRKRK